MNLRDSLINFFAKKTSQDSGISKIDSTGYEAYSVGEWDLNTSSSKTKEYLKQLEGWVGAAVSAIADEVAVINIKLYEIKNGDVEEVKDHPALKTLYKVNPFTTKFDHFWLTQTYLELTGESPWF